MNDVDAVIRGALGEVFPAAQLEVRQIRAGAGRSGTWTTLFSGAYGWLDPETMSRPARPGTLFDLASVTKLFVVTAFMTLVEEAAVRLDQPVSDVLPEFSGMRAIGPYEDPLVPGAWVAVAPAPGDEPASVVDAGRVTFRHLLTHSSGLPAWRPLYRAGSPDAALALALGTHFSYPTGSRVVYSDIGLILLGLAIERMAHVSLDEAIRRRVTEPLGQGATRYLPIVPHGSSPVHLEGVAPTEVCAWRGRRLVGEVHDENAAGLGGVAGHAGLFSTAADVAALGQMYLAARVADVAARGTNSLSGGRPLLRPETVAEMTRLQAEDGDTRRGLGFALWSPDPGAAGYPLGPEAYGHTGFTGTSLWIDPGRGLVVACLTNRVYYGRDARGILAFRVALHRAIVEATDS